jgi:hypothetical protein
MRIVLTKEENINVSGRSRRRRRKRRRKKYKKQKMKGQKTSMRKRRGRRERAERKYIYINGRAVRKSRYSFPSPAALQPEISCTVVYVRKSQFRKIEITSPSLIISTQDSYQMKQLRFRRNTTRHSALIPQG